MFIKCRLLFRLVDKMKETGKSEAEINNFKTKMQEWVVGLLKKERFSNLEFYSSEKGLKGLLNYCIFMLIRRWWKCGRRTIGNPRIPRWERSRSANGDVGQAGIGGNQMCKFSSKSTASLWKSFKKDNIVSHFSKCDVAV